MNMNMNINIDININININIDINININIKAGAKVTGCRLPGRRCQLAWPKQRRLTTPLLFGQG